MILNTYKINAFPTLLFVNGEGGEVYRIVGSKKEAELLQVGADALASKTVYPVNSQAQQQIALIGREIPDFCYRDSTGKEVKFSSFRGNYVCRRRQTALKGACKAWSTRFHAPFGPPAGSTIRASTPARLAPSISVSSLSPIMAVSAAVTPACSMAR